MSQTFDFTDPDNYATYFAQSSWWGWDDPNNPTYTDVSIDQVRTALKRPGTFMIESNAGPQSLPDGVTVTGYGLDGAVSSLAFSNRNGDDSALGVANYDGRWVGQIDFYEDHPEHGQNVSERIEFDFGGTVDNVVLGIGLMGSAEGANDSPETGKWTAFDDAGNQVGAGLLGPAESDGGNVGNYGTYLFTLTTSAPMEVLVIEATGFNHNQDGASGAGAFKKGEENSDFGLTSLAYDRVTGGSPPTENEFRGTGGRDRAEGTAENDVLFGYGGQDTLIGLDGSDLIYGGSGADLLIGDQDPAASPAPPPTFGEEPPMFSTDQDLVDILALIAELSAANEHGGLLP